MWVFFSKKGEFTLLGKGVKSIFLQPKPDEFWSLIHVNGKKYSLYFLFDETNHSHNKICCEHKIESTFSTKQKIWREIFENFLQCSIPYIANSTWIKINILNCIFLSSSMNVYLADYGTIFTVNTFLDRDKKLWLIYPQNKSRLL